jgi:hypothetical protein
MGFIKLDDGTPEHPKIHAAGDSAAWMWVTAICYSTRQLTDGYIPDDVLMHLSRHRAPKSIASRCVAAELFEPVEGGFQVHDYLEHQVSREDRLKAREQWAQRQRRARAARNGGA